MIKRNESYVGDGGFFLDLGKNSVQIPLFHNVFGIVKSFITSVTRYLIVMGLHQNEAF